MSGLRTGRGGENVGSPTGSIDPRVGATAEENSGGSRGREAEESLVCNPNPTSTRQLN